MPITPKQCGDTNSHRYPLEAMLETLNAKTVSIRSTESTTDVHHELRRSSEVGLSLRRSVFILDGLVFILVFVVIMIVCALIWLGPARSETSSASVAYSTTGLTLASPKHSPGYPSQRSPSTPTTGRFSLRPATGLINCNQGGRLLMDATARVSCSKLMTR